MRLESGLKWYLNKLLTLQLRRLIVTKYAIYVPTVVLLLTTLANAATPAITAFWASHATAAAIIAPLAVIVAHWLPSPSAGANSGR